MAKRVFFSFHWADVIDFRANVVRQHWVAKLNRDEAGFFDASLWETAKKTSPTAVKRIINSGLDGTSVTCALIGSYTYARRWVRYELMKSFRKGNAMLGVHINCIAGRDQQTKPAGPNPFEYLGVTFSQNGATATLHEIVDGTWKEYSEIDGSATYQTGGVAEQFRGKGFNLSRWYKIYDWNSDNGYANFATWIAS
jgi:hypothetical protein